MQISKGCMMTEKHFYIVIIDLKEILENNYDLMQN